MAKALVLKAKSGIFDVAELRTELLRKSIHLTVGLVPILASISLNGTMALLAVGTLFYLFTEKVRLDGSSIPFISDITLLASRSRDKGNVVLGPITLGVGAMACLLLYPQPAATIGLYALAFGDGFSSLIGKFFGTIKLPYTGGKTLEGTLAGVIAVVIAVFAKTGNPGMSISIALFAGVLELLPLKDFDNILIPVGTGYFAYLLYYTA